MSRVEELEREIRGLDRELDHCGGWLVVDPDRAARHRRRLTSDRRRLEDALAEAVAEEEAAAELEHGGLS